MVLVKGSGTLWICDARGRCRRTMRRDNLIVNGSKFLVADLLRNHPLSSPLQAIAVGSNGAAASSGQTTLLAEVARKALPAADTDTTLAKNLRSGTTIIIRQTFGPGLAFTLRESSLFGDIVALANPTVAPGLTASDTGGTLTAGTYTVVYTWKNNNGETQASPSAQATISSSTGKMTVTLPALPSGATQARVFAGIGSPVLSGTSITTSFVVSAPPAGPDTPPGVNTSLIPGVANSGRMVNRLVWPDASILIDETFTIEKQLVVA